MTTTLCETDAEFAEQLWELARWNAEQGYVPMKIDPGFGDELRQAFEKLGVADLCTERRIRPRGGAVRPSIECHRGVSLRRTCERALRGSSRSQLEGPTSRVRIPPAPPICRKPRRPPHGEHSYGRNMDFSVPPAVTVGIWISPYPPLRSPRARLGHGAPTSGV